VSGAIEKIINGYADIDLALSGMGRSDEQHVSAARAELAALREENERLREFVNFTADAGKADHMDVAVFVKHAVRLRAALSSPAPAGAFVPLQQLREIEWESEGCCSQGGELTSFAACPACGGAEPRFEPNDPPILGHAEDCWLAAAIKRAEATCTPRA